MGLPFERVTVFEETMVEALDESESPNFATIVSCVDGLLVWSSRDNRSVRYHPSGCYGALNAGSTGQIHFRDISGCEYLDDERVEYAEIVRIGTAQVIYRGRIAQWRDPRFPP